jgi:hypothetical protein
MRTPALAAALAFDLLVIVLAVSNIPALRDAAALPPPYEIPAMSTDYRSGTERAPTEITSLDGMRVARPELLPFVLGALRRGDSVRVIAAGDGQRISDTVALLPRFSTFDIFTSQIVGFVFLLFGIWVLLRHRRAGYAGILHALAVGTAVMILLDWGSQAVHGTALHLLLRFVFDAAIWLLPALFFHFSFIYPVEKDLPKRMILLPFYAVSAAGIALSAWYLGTIHLSGIPMQDTLYMEIHGTYNDVFLIIGLLCTIANFEHSALTIPDPVQRKNAYWVLLGIMAGPLVYVFMMLVPRMLLDHELVSNSVLQYTLLIAPIMFWKALRVSGPADAGGQKKGA